MRCSDFAAQWQNLFVGVYRCWSCVYNSIIQYSNQMLVLWAEELGSSLKHSLKSSCSVEESELCVNIKGKQARRKIRSKQAEGEGKIEKEKHEKWIVQCCSFMVPCGIKGFYIRVKHWHSFFFFSRENESNENFLKDTDALLKFIFSIGF